MGKVLSSSIDGFLRNVHWAPAWLCAGLVLAALGCNDPQRSGPADGELLVSAAVSLQSALRDAADGFQTSRPGVRVRLNTGASGLLLQQLLRGAPVDLYISASSKEIDRLEQAGRMLPGSRTTVASNRMVVVVPKGGTAPESLEALRDAIYGRIAIGNPRTSPAGRYAEQLLKTHGLWGALGSRLVPAESVRQALAYVVRGEVEAALLYRTDARLAVDRLELALEMSPSTHDPILYQGAVLSDAHRPELAQEFLSYLTSDDAQRRLARHGFLPPPER